MYKVSRNVRVKDFFCFLINLVVAYISILARGIGYTDGGRGSGKPHASPAIWRRSVFYASSASQARSVRIVPAFHVSRFTCFLADSRMLLFWDHGLIRSPEIGEAVTCTVGKWNGLPQTATGGLAAISNGIRDQLFGSFGTKRPRSKLGSSCSRALDQSSSNSRIVESGLVASGAITVSLNGASSAAFFDPCDDRVA